MNLCRIHLPALALGMAVASGAHAQDHSAHAQHAPPHAHTPAARKPAEPVDHSKMDHSTMDHSKMGHAMQAPSQPVQPIPPVTDADRAAAFPTLQEHMAHAPELNHYLLFNRLEVADADHGTGQAWEAQGWIGSDINRLWLRSEGEREDSRTESADLEVLYGRSVSPWWDVVAGVKHDFKPGASQTWGAFGVQGLAPYKFEVSATAYVGESGRFAANVEAEYELLLTNRLILQPLLELDFNGKDDPRRGVGSGLSTAEAGLRLRYEFTRQFAPYIGVVHERAFGETADLRRDEGEDAQDTRFVAGLRFWF
ncbi:copper resistance protein B [Lysobacter panacisoli]|nr:copper resistance protein B [Lysobacter panacisoli]